MGGQQLASIGKIINTEMNYLQLPGAAATLLDTAFYNHHNYHYDDKIYRYQERNFDIHRTGSSRFYFFLIFFVLFALFLYDLCFQLFY